MLPSRSAALPESAGPEQALWSTSRTFVEHGEDLAQLGELRLGLGARVSGESVTYKWGGSNEKGTYERGHRAGCWGHQGRVVRS